MTSSSRSEESRPPARGKLLLWVVAAVGLTSCCLLLPSVQKVRDGEGRVYSALTLKQIGLALHAYHDTHHKLPPAVVTDKEGRPLYSWRVLLLPFLEEMRLYQRFKLDEPWDGPQNKTLLGQTPRGYSPFGLGDAPPGQTRYQVFVGPGTAFERDGLTWNDFPDGLANTLPVVEAGTAVPWSNPGDLTYAPDQPLPPLGRAFTKSVCFLGYPVRRQPGFNGCFGDGTVRFLSSTTDEGTIRALITRNGGELVDVSKLE